jgi:prephenate dehydratase
MKEFNPSLLIQRKCIILCHEKHMELLQMTSTIACLGPDYTFCHLMALKLYGSTDKLIFLDSFQGVANTVKEGKADAGILPFWNSNYAHIDQAIESIFSSNTYISRVEKEPINLHLITEADSLDKVKLVSSIKPVFGQASKWLDSHLPTSRCNREYTSSTAEAVRMAKNIPEKAAVGPSEAAQHYSVPILVSDIENQNNFTIFFELRNKIPLEHKDINHSLWAMWPSDIVPLEKYESAVYPMIRKVLKKIGIEPTVLSAPIKVRDGSAIIHLLLLEASGYHAAPFFSELCDRLRAQHWKVTCLGSYRNNISSFARI